MEIKPGMRIVQQARKLESYLHKMLSNRCHSRRGKRILMGVLEEMVERHQMRLCVIKSAVSLHHGQILQKQVRHTCRLLS